VIAWLPIVVLLAAAAIEPLRLPALFALLVGFVVIGGSRRGIERSGSAAAFVLGGCLVAVLGMAWSGVALPPEALNGGSCATLLAPFALYRAAGALLVVLAMAIVAHRLRTTAAEIGLRRPSRIGLGVAIGALAAVGIVATVLGPTIAAPFFGPLPVRTGNLVALAPALLFAVANATMEEVAYRGALLRSIMRWRGPLLALVIQAAAFGLAHGVGGAFTGSPLPVMAATAATGLAFGALSLRTGSLLLPIALHAALDIPIYYANACVVR
jgi:membrane protease YdiL (CAAX protease family)